MPDNVVDRLEVLDYLTSNIIGLYEGDGLAMMHLRRNRSDNLLVNK